MSFYIKTPQKQVKDEKKKKKQNILTFYLYLHNIGCGSVMPNLKTKFSFVMALASRYI